MYSSQATGRAHTCYRPWRVQQLGDRHSSHLLHTLKCTAVRPQAQLTLVTDLEVYSSQATPTAHTCYRPWRVQQSGDRHSSHLLQTLKGTAVRPQAQLTLVTDLEVYSSQATDTSHTCYRPAKSSDKPEDLGVILNLNLPPSRFILKFFRFFRTLLVIPNNMYIDIIEVLLFSTSFVISVLFEDDKRKK